MKKIFTVSLVAIMAATAANADIASTKYVEDRTGTTANLTTTAKELTGAVNELKTKLDTVAGEGEGSVADQIDVAKQELTTEIGKVDDKADANAGEISTLKSTSATKTELSDGLALKQDVANLATALTDGMNKETTYPSVSLMEEQIAKSNNAVGDEIADLTQLVNTNETDIEGKVSALTTTVANNKTAADTAIQEAKDAAAAASTAAANALTNAKAYADEQDATQTTTITNAYKAADTALETSLKAYADAEDKKIEDQIGTVEQGKTVVQMITEAKEAASGDAGEVASDLEAYISSNNTAVAAAKKAGDDAQADLDAYKASNDTAVANAQTNAVASAKTYTDGEIDKVETAYAAADTALETSLKSYADTAEADAIAAAKTAGDAAYAAKSYEAIVDADKAFRESITAGTTGSDGAYALTATVTNGTVSGYKWEQIGR